MYIKLRIDLRSGVPSQFEIVENRLAAATQAAGYESECITGLRSESEVGDSVPRTGIRGGGTEGWSSVREVEGEGEKELREGKEARPSIRTLGRQKQSQKRVRWPK